MRKIKLQMNTSLDGIVTVVKTETGGINWNWDDEVRRFCISNLTDVDCILLGRNTAEVFIPHWKGVSNDPQHQDYEFWKTVDRYSEGRFFRQA